MAALAFGITVPGCESGGSDAAPTVSGATTTILATVSTRLSVSTVPTSASVESTIVPSSPTSGAPMHENRLLVDRLPRSVAAVVAVAGEMWTRLDYVDRTVPAHAETDTLAEFGVKGSESVASVRAVLEEGDVTIVDGGVDADTMRTALVAADSAPHVVAGVEVFPVPKAGAGLAQSWFRYDSVAFADDFLVLISGVDENDPGAADIVASIVAARDTEPTGADATVTLLKQVLGGDIAWAFQGGSDAATDIRRVNQRATQQKLGEILEASGARLAPTGLVHGAVGLDASATTIVAEFATAADAARAADAYRTIWETGTYNGSTWRELIGPLSIAADDDLVIGTSDRRLHLGLNPMAWTAAS
jgi:hypothetical protein